MAETPDDPLMERLKSHSQVFDGLLSLIPAKLYYGEDTSGQWNRKKQTKEEAKKAKIAKLDPDNFKSAKDVLDEKELKRKRDDEDSAEAENDQVEDGEEGNLSKEKPLEGLKRPKKKQRKQDESDAQEGKPSTTNEAPSEGPKPLSKIKLKKKAKKQRRIERQQAAALNDVAATQQQDETKDLDPAVQKTETKLNIQPPPVEEQGDSSPALPTPSSMSSTFDTLHDRSASSSSSSIVPSSTEIPFVKRNIPKATTEELRARLSAKIAALRTARKADDESNARSRQELMETRRKKEQQRKARKAELRRQREIEEKMQRDAALEASLRNSPASILSEMNSPLWPGSPIPEANHNFSFGRVAFEDGQSMDASLSSMIDPRKEKGPSDVGRTLQVAEVKQEKLKGLSPAERAAAEEKDRWVKAGKRIHGEKVRDDVSLLKKTLKRKENSKKKSEGEWQERLDAVEKGKEDKQKKRDDNIKKRREEKGGKGSKKPGNKPKKRKNRPGFEGSFRSKSKKGFA